MLPTPFLRASRDSSKMAFVLRFSGFNKRVGLGKPRGPLQITLTSTNTQINSATFSIGNYQSEYESFYSVSTTGGTVSRNGSTVSLTGLSGSTTYTVTVSVRTSGGTKTASSTITTLAPPPFFPPWFPPWFPPFFPPFFPPNFPPRFPPRFPPNFPPRFRPPRFGGGGGKTIPTMKVNEYSERIKVLTQDFGYVEEKYLSSEDILVSLRINNLDELHHNSWSSDNIIISEEYTTIEKITARESKVGKVYINGQKFYDSHLILSKVDSVVKFTKSVELSVGDQIFDYDIKEFIDINEINIVENQTEILYDINLSPYNIIIVENAIVYNL